MSQMENVEEILPLSATQIGMLFETIRADAPTGTYVGVVSVAIDGPVSPDALKAAMDAVLEARDAFRACFIWEGVSQPLQVIRAKLSLPFDFHDLSDLDACAYDARREALIETERATGFDLTSAPLMRATLLRKDDTTHHLIWSVHHIISDAWSTRVVLEEIAARLAGEAPAKPAQFRDYLSWQQSRSKIEEAAFWKAYLAGLTEATRINASAPATAESQMHLRRKQQGLPLASLRAFAKAQRVTLTTVLSTAWALLLRRYSGMDDVIFGQTHSGRPPMLKGMEHAAGAFITTLPLRLQIDPAEPWIALVGRAETDATALRRHQFASLADLRDLSPLTGDAALFETLFVVEDVADPAQPAGPIRFHDIQALDASSYPLAVLVTPGKALTLEVIYDPQRLSPEIIDAMLSDFADLLEQVPVVTGSVADLTKACWACPVTASGGAAFQPITDAILTHSSATPEASAVVAADHGLLSYAALEQASGYVAARLQGMGVGKGDVIPVALERGADVVVAMLGILRTGAAYTPLDLDYPAERLAHILKAVAPRAIVTAVTASDRLPATSALQLFLDEPDGEAPVFQPVTLQPDDLAYVIFTSGSTGGPKGVAVSHANLAYSTQVRDQTYPSAPDAFLMLSSFAFDSSVVGIYWTLSTGGKLVISRPRLEQDLTAMGDVIAEERISHLLCLPVLYQTMLTGLPTAKTQSLATVIVAGEAVPPGLTDQHRACLPGARLFNEYGPTEATVWCAAADITDHAVGDIPIGTPPAGTTLRIVDRDGHPLPAFIRGEIIVAGPGIAQGYWQDQPATEAVFTPLGYKTGDLGYLNAAGQVVYQGRSDAQVKIRGHRIELAEIEAAIHADTGCEAVVLVKPSGSAQGLAGFVAGHTDILALRQSLIRRMPGYMVPASLTPVDEIPRLPNGKTDTKALLTMETAPISGQDPPRNVAERHLAAIWSDVLGRADIARSDNFFDLGGDSLKTIAVGLKAEAAGLAIAAEELFEYPVLKDLAEQTYARAEGAAPTTASDDLWTVSHKDGEKPPFLMVHGSLKMQAYLRQALGPARPMGFLFSHYKSGEVSASVRLEELAQDGVHRLKALRSEGPYHLGGYSLGAVIALEMAQQLTQAGDEVASLFLLDPSFGVRFPEGAGSENTSAHTKRLLEYARGIGLMTYYKTAQGVVADSERARMSYVGNAYRKMLTQYQPPIYGQPVHVMLSLDGTEKHGETSWLKAALPDMSTDTIPFRHLDLQKDPDALLAWTSALARHLNSVT